MTSGTQSASGDWASVEVYVRVFRVWDHMPDDARTWRAPRGTGRSQYAGSRARDVPVAPRQVVSTPQVSISSRWGPLMSQGKLQRRGPDRPPRELQPLKEGINGEVVPSRG